MMHVGAGGIRALREYESKVIPILKEHGGELVSAFTPQNSNDPECPDEVHLITFPSEEAFQSYRADNRILSLSGLRDASLSKTQLLVSKEIIEYR